MLGMNESEHNHMICAVDTDMGCMLRLRTFLYHLWDIAVCPVQRLLVITALRLANNYYVALLSRLNTTQRVTPMRSDAIGV